MDDIERGPRGEPMTFDQMAARAQYEWQRAEEAEAERRFVTEELEALRASLAAGATAPQPERVQHIKRGSTYQVIGRGAVQTGEPLHDNAEVVVYMGVADGKLWVRPVSEFEDGRFLTLGS